MSYLRHVFDAEHRPFILKQAQATLSKVDFDTIVATGLSGVIPGTLLAHLMGKKLVVVRRPSEFNGADSTHGSLIEGEMGKRWIWIDDFICSGRTRDRVMKVIKEHRRCREAVFVGTYLWAVTETPGFEYAVPPEPESEINPPPYEWGFAPAATEEAEGRLTAQLGRSVGKIEKLAALYGYDGASMSRYEVTMTSTASPIEALPKKLILNTADDKISRIPWSKLQGPAPDLSEAAMEAVMERVMQSWEDCQRERPPSPKAFRYITSIDVGL